jgi:hypothetical protein
MLLTEAVLAFAEGRTPTEIAKESGLPLPDVMRTIAFLAKFSFVRTQGLSLKVDEALLRLPTD